MSDDRATGVDKVATLRQMAERQLQPGTVSYGGEGIFARGVIYLADEVERLKAAVRDLADDHDNDYQTPQRLIDALRRLGGE